MANPGDRGGLVIAGMILVAGGLLFFLILSKDGYERWREKSRFMAVAKEANATIVGHEARSGAPGGRSGRRSGVLVPIVRFTDARGVEWTHTMGMITPNERRKGEKLTVLYEPANPRNVWEGPPSLDSYAIGLAVSGGAVALGLALIVVYGRR